MKRAGRSNGAIAVARAALGIVTALPELSEVLEKQERLVIAGRHLSLEIGDTGVERVSRGEIDETVAAIRRGPLQ